MCIRDRERWLVVLANFGVDEDSRQELFLLSQFGDDGKFAANYVINELMKKGHLDNVNKPSAFLHACVLKARHDLEKTWASLHKDQHRAATKR